ncbi:hypothetical protein EMCRGX_G023548 [Ephydatia muelleri]
MAMYSGFSEDYLEKVLHEENESDGWALANRSQHAEVWKKKYPNESLQVIKAFLHLPGVPPNDAVKLVQDVEVRKRWDTQFSAIDVLEEHPTHRMVYWSAPLPLGMQTRDIVQYIAEKRDEVTDTTYILYSQVPEYVVAAKPGIVRAVTIQSAVIVRPDLQDPRSTRMTLLFQTDFGGRLPKFMVNFFSAFAPPKWRRDMYNFYVKFYSKEKNCNEMTVAAAVRDMTGTEHSTLTPCVEDTQPLCMSTHNFQSFDFSVTSPLNLLNLLEARVSPGAAVHASEIRKHNSNDGKCGDLDPKCSVLSTPLAVETYGCWGAEARERLSRLATRLAIPMRCTKSQDTAAIYGRLNLTLVRSCARALLSRAGPSFVVTG